MNADKLQGQWQQVKGKVKEKWGQLTDDDISRIDGDREQLEGRIRERYGHDKERVSRDVDDWYTQQGW